MDNLEQNIYFYVINSVSFLKTLKKENCENELTAKFANYIQVINSVYYDIADLKEKTELIKVIDKCIDLTDKCHKLLQPIFFDNKKVINEQATLLIEASEIKKQLINKKANIIK